MVQGLQFAKYPRRGREIIATADSLVVTGVNGDNMLLIRTDPQGLSGTVCQSPVAMQAIRHLFTTLPIYITNRVPPPYREEESDPLTNFNVAQAFCNWDIIVGSLDPSIVVYPTIANTTINIELKSPSDVEGSVALFDAYKKLHVQTIPPGTSNVTLDVSHLTPGLYYLVISSNGKETTSKFIKQ